MKLVSRVFAVLLCVFMGTMLLGGEDSWAEGAWIGTGEGSIGTSTGGGGGCYDYPGAYTNYGYLAGCAGVSWAFYKSTKSTTRDVEFPYLGGGIRTADDPVIPAGCSEHTSENGGFWHYGINAWGAGYGNQEGWGEGWQSGGYIYTNGQSWASYKRFYGHWTTITPSIFSSPYVSWFPSQRNTFPDYKGNPEAQRVDVYVLSRFASSTDEVLEAYNKARALAGRGEIDYLPSNVWGFCYWDGMEGSIEGKSTVGNESLTSNKTTDWVNQNKTAETYFVNCATTGCKVKFSHSLKRKAGNYTTNYTVKRTSNYTQEGIDTKTLKSSNEDFSGASDSGKEEFSEILTLRPGQVVCESLEFSPRGNDEKATTTVCASALGDAQPKGDDAFLNIVVKNNDVARYNSYRKEVYAKPGDTVNYQSTYHPLLQYTYNIVPQKIQINGGTIYPTSGKNTTLLMWKIFNDNKGSGLKNWNNDFSVWRSDNNFANSSLVKHYGNYDNGNTSEQKEANDYRIEVGNVGKSIDQKAITNYYEASKTTPTQVTFYNRDGYNVANVITDEKSSVANVRVPYNYKNTTVVKKSQNDEIVYAGEETSIFFDIRINPKSNTYTMNSGDKDYATSVANGEYRLDVCVGGHVANCSQGQKREYPDNPTVGKGKFTTEEGKVGLDKMYDGKPISQSLTIQVPDVEAGTDVCVVSRVWPENSGGDNNYNDPDGNHRWASSEEKCFKVAKKPSLQVWGGNIYSTGDIKTVTAEKTDTRGYDGTHVFGSWGELGIIANGKVEGLASGAGMGYSDLDLVHKPGGSTSTQFCDSSTLSFANGKCGSFKYVGEISSIDIDNPASKVINKDRDAILRKFGFKKEENNSNILYDYDSNDFEIGDKTIDKSIIQVYQSDGTIKIVGDMVYEDVPYSFTKNGENKEGEFLPKLIIMAKNIDIDCYVERIDGILVAESTVTTSKCDGSEDINASVNSHPLTINGAVIASKIVANRTYGAATGDNSFVAAETINFDPSLYLWGELGTKDTTGNGESIGSGGKRNYLDVTYIRELAPRY